MRPTKLTTNLLDAFRAVLADEWAAIAFTEEELVWQANQRLVVEERITYRTYQRYKADILYMAEQGDDEIERTTDAEDEANALLVQDMYDTLRGALMVQKRALVKGVCEGLPNWRRYSWMLERKFPDFRLRVPVNGEREIVREKEEGVQGKNGDKGEKKPETEEEKRKRREAWAAKMAAEAEAAKPKTVEEKWERRYHQPWKPMHLYAEAYYKRAELQELEAEMERDVAAGYINPYAHLNYRPDTEQHESGIYKCFGMGEGKLPLRVHLLRDCDSPKSEHRQQLWEEQERKRQNIILAEQGLPPIELPPLPPSEESGQGYGQVRGRILGFSG